jgi:hypothetical protein
MSPPSTPTLRCAGAALEPQRTRPGTVRASKACHEHLHTATTKIVLRFAGSVKS